jgi:hypothetical protein
MTTLPLSTYQSQMSIHDNCHLPPCCSSPRCPQRRSSWAAASPMRRPRASQSCSTPRPTGQAALQAARLEPAPAPRQLPHGRRCPLSAPCWRLRRPPRSLAWPRCSSCASTAPAPSCWAVTAATWACLAAPYCHRSPQHRLQPALARCLMYVCVWRW